MKLSPADRKRLVPVLESLIEAIETVALGGLTSASEGTRAQLGASFQEASRLRLLRLGSALRVANQELGRFTGDAGDFSAKRLLLFLSHAWVLARGLIKAIEEDDQAAYERLAGTPSREPIEAVELITLGVVKKVVPGAFCAFEFRLRAVGGALEPGTPATWSCVFPLPEDARLAPETFLHTEQKQKFRPRQFLTGKVLRIERAALARDGRGGAARILLGPDSAVSEEREVTDWESWQRWDAAAALETVAAHEPGPLDLEVEPTTEVVLREWSLEKAEPDADERLCFPVEADGVRATLVTSPGKEGAHLAAELEALRKQRTRKPLYALAHYARCGVVLRPLSVLEPAPRHLDISRDYEGAADLIRKLKLF